MKLQSSQNSRPTIMDIDYPDKRKFLQNIGCSIAAKSALFLTESQKRRGNEFGQRAWVLGHLRTQDGLSLKSTR